jgi:predicted Zn-dependent protease
MSEEPGSSRSESRRRASWWRALQVRGGFVIALFVVLGFVVGLLAFSSARQGWNRWQKNRILHEAAHLLAENQLAEAETKAHEALAIDPDSLEATRILSEATEKQNRAETVAWRAQIARLDPGLESELNLASAALRFGQFDVAREALKRVAPKDREKAAYHVVAGWLSRAQGNVADEERHFAAAVAQEPLNDVYQFNLAVLQILSPDPEKNAAARNQLERLSKVAQFRTEALRALLDNALRQNQSDAANALAQQLQMSPEVTFADYLLCLDLYRKLNPKNFDALLEKVQPVAARHGHDLAQLIEWMNKNDLASRALKWSEKLPDDLTTHPPAAIAIAASLALTKNWSRLKRWTRTGSWGEDEYLRLAYKAYAVRGSRRGGAEDEFDALWASAEETAAANPDQQLALARLASKWDLPQEAESLWLEVAKRSTARREALDALYKIYRETNDLPNLLLTAQRLHDTSPEEAGLTANAARLALLLDRSAAEGRTLAGRAYKKAPNDPAVVLTYAFALYSAGRTAEGLEVLEKLSPEQLRDPHVAVYAALLYDEQNMREVADQYLAFARAADLFPEEKQLLREIALRRQNAVLSPNEASTSPTPP